MKLAFFTAYYPPFLNSLYRQNPGLAAMPFQQQLDKILDQFFADTGAAYYYSKKHLQEAIIIISNCEPLQKAWASENNIEYDQKNWQQDISLAQLKQFKPDVLFIESIFEFYGAFLSLCKSFCRKIIAWISTPVKDDLKLNDITLILSSTPAFVDRFRSKGIHSEYMLPAFDTRILDNLPVHQEKDIPFSFAGGWSDLHLNRKEALKELVKFTPLQIWGYGYRKTYPIHSLKFYKQWFIKQETNILNAYRDEVWGLDMFNIFARSIVTFNIHESLLEGYVGNMRMFEATGIGTCLLNDNGTNLALLFTEGKEIVIYDSIEEAIEKANYYIAHPNEAAEIGKNAQQRTICDYNYDIYIQQLLAYFKKYI